ncbi:MAG TPA: helicase-associated domain-containing protein [Anaerolineales bacterium]|nr:helicase-associated domain-containing protein [Anaerolineales bacterium]
MRTLALALQDHDFGHLRIIASLWGFDLSGGSAPDVAIDLARSMLDRALLVEIVDSLPAPAREALEALLRNRGRLPLADLTRQYGSLRQMGPGRRDREQPWRQETSPIEALWYRGLITMTFLDTPTGPQEFGYIPRDLLDLFPAPDAVPDMLRVKSVSQPDDVRLASDFAVDDLVTLLAALRRRPAPSIVLSPERLQGLHPFLHQPASARLILACLLEERVLTNDRLVPDPESVRVFLDCARPEILRRMRDAWRTAEGWNDLAQVPHLHAASGQWPNAPRVSRQAVLDLLGRLMIGEWWDLGGFIQAVHETQPAFQRPAGDFDSWYLQDTRTGGFVRGLAHWHAVEGALIHGVITGPLYWLGMLDLGLAGPDGSAIAFRLRPAFDRSSKQVATPSQEGSEHIPPTQVRPDGLITVPRLVAPGLRYQIARICAWESRDMQAYHYRLTPDGLALAASQGLEPSHIRTILESASGSPLPKSLTTALERWSESGTQARLERMLIFTVEHPTLLEELRRNRSTGRYLRDTLGPRSASVADRDWRRLCEAAARIGILIEPPGPVGGGSP